MALAAVTALLVLVPVSGGRAVADQARCCYTATPTITVTWSGRVTETWTDITNEGGKTYTDRLKSDYVYKESQGFNNEGLTVTAAQSQASGTETETDNYPGSTAQIERGKPVLERMGKRVVHCGEPGNGQVAKICNNMILGISMIAVSEAFVLGEKLGLSHQALFDVASASSGQCWSLTSYCPVPGPVPASPANNDYKPGFAAALMLKDLKLAREAAQSVEAKTELGAQAADIYEHFAEQGHSGADFSAIIKLVRGQS